MSMSQSDKVIFLVRHCQDLPSDDLDQECAARVPLTPFGVQQAHALGRFLRSQNVEAVYTSIFDRSKETAEIIHSHTGGYFAVDERLNEQVLARGRLDKVDAKEIKQRMLEDPYFIPDSGQSLLQSIELFSSSLDEKIGSSHQRICIVSHGFLMQAALHRRFVLAKAPELAEGSVSVIEFDGEQLKLVHHNLRPYTFLRAKQKGKDLLRQMLALIYSRFARN